MRRQTVKVMERAARELREFARELQEWSMGDPTRKRHAARLWRLVESLEREAEMIKGKL